MKPVLTPREFVVCLPCSVCGAPPPSDPDHRPTRSRGGDDRFLWPLCHRHHVEIHSIGIETFERKYEVRVADCVGLVAASYLRVFGRVGIFSESWIGSRLQEIRRGVVNRYLSKPIE